MTTVTVKGHSSISIHQIFHYQYNTSQKRQGEKEDEIFSLWYKEG
jgi:hypothetical protein